MDLLKDANLAVGFLLELAALAARGWWGYQAGGGTLVRLGRVVGLPLVVAVVWGRLIALKAVMPPPGAVRLLLQIVIVGAAARAGSGHRSLAAVSSVVVIVNVVLIRVWDP